MAIENEWSPALRVLREFWYPPSLRYPQRVFLVRLENGDEVETVAEDQKDPDLLLFPAETNVFFQGVIRAWRQAGNAAPTREEYLQKL